MSLNKVLNRPMFRQEALRKGVLKLIKARTGLSIGPNRPPVPMVIPQGGSLGTTVGAPYNYGVTLRKQPGLFNRMGSGIKSLARNTLSIPAAGGYYVGDKVGQALGIESDLGRMPLGIAGATMATKALPTLAGIGMVPSAIIGAAGYGVYDRTKAGIELRKKINAMSPKERAEFERQNRLKSTDYMSEGVTDEELFGKIDPKKLDDIVKNPRETIPNPGSGRPGSKKFVQKKGDVATAPDNVTRLGKTKVIDTAKVAENAMPPQISDEGGNMDNMTGSILPPDADTPVVTEDKKEDSQEKKGGSTADQDSLTANSAFKIRLDMAKDMVKEMKAGKTSNANLVFLSNLASGLLTGTTRKSGIGGALEVFGTALGPAVNNMVMVKMKEDEIDQNLMGRALDFTSDFFAAQNQAFEMPETEEVGVVQYTNEAGRTVNVPGRILKDGTKQMATGRADANGMYTYNTVDPNFNFIANKDKNKETLELAKGIAGKYAAVNLINRSLGIINQGDAQAGITGAIGLYGGRITEALGDVLNFTPVFGESTSELKAAGKATFEIEKNKAAIALVASGEFEDKQKALKYLNTSLGTFDKNYNSSLRNAKDNLKLSGNQTKLDYERLAINETVLVYKLANSLKAKDRLTQKDIEMARGLVKVFPLLRGETNVIASLTATAETILDDIKQQERLYETAGGSSEYLLNERKAYGLLPENMTVNNMTDFDSKKFRDLQDKIGKMTEEDFEKIFPSELFGD
jgi:hypothetical protein